MEYGTTPVEIGWKASWIHGLLMYSEVLWYSVPETFVIPPGQLKDFLLQATYQWKQVKAKVIKLLIWKESPEISENTLKEIFQQFQWKTIMVRSNSRREDGENMFVGVYDSSKIECTSEKMLFSALNTVYQSFNSDEAIEYRRIHSISEDSIGVVIQEFVEGMEWWGYGVIHTSLPHNKDYMIISGWNHRAVTDGEDDIWNTQLLKRQKELVITAWKIPDRLREGIQKLKDITIKLEEVYGASNIEFVIGKDGTIHLFQQRNLGIPPVQSLLSESERIIRLDDFCPAYFTGLPVLVMPSFEDQVIRQIKDPAISFPEFYDWGKDYDSILKHAKAINSFAPQIGEELMYEWFKTITQFNQSNPNGWVLCIPNGLPENFSQKKIDEFMFSNLKAVVKTDLPATYSNALSHVEVRARSESVPVIFVERNFHDKDRVQLKTGDILSIREHCLVRDKKVEKVGDEISLLAYFPWICLRRTQENELEILFLWDEKRIDVFYNYLNAWLKEKSKVSVEKNPLLTEIGCDFLVSWETISMRWYKSWPTYLALTIGDRLNELWFMNHLIDCGLSVKKSSYLERTGHK